MRDTKSFCDQFDTDLHRRWKVDRAVRRRVPFNETWRGCLGLAMLLARPDDTEYHGTAALVRNDQLTWVAMRDVPAGHFPGSASMNRRDVNYANATVAELRYGMPVIDFRRGARTAIDFRFMPFPAHARRFGARPWERSLVRPAGDTLDSEAQAREFAVLNRVSAAMTRFALWATDGQGRPVRPAWAVARPAEADRYQVVGPSSWMPRPYLAFPLATAERLYWLATEARAGEFAWECPACHGVVGGGTFARAARAKVQVLDGGDFVATCVHCGRRGKWHLDDGRPCRVRRHFPPAFRDGFCRAVADGFQAVTLGPEVYCGPCRSTNAVAPSDDEVGARLDLVPHRLMSRVDHRRRVVFLPRASRVTAAVGRALDAGDAWAEVLGPATPGWRRRDAEVQWATLRTPCGGPGMVGYLQRLWFESRMVRLAAAPGEVLVPADLAANIVREIEPVRLWWDTAPAMPFYKWEQEAAVFPPLRVRRWDGLRLALPGEVALDASIADPRFSIRKVASTRVDPAADGPAREHRAKSRLRLPLALANSGRPARGLLAG